MRDPSTPAVRPETKITSNSLIIISAVVVFIALVGFLRIPYSFDRPRAPARRGNPVLRISPTSRQFFDGFVKPKTLELVNDFSGLVWSSLKSSIQSPSCTCDPRNLLERALHGVAAGASSGSFIDPRLL
jgi:hypothetical protein